MANRAFTVGMAGLFSALFIFQGFAVAPSNTINTSDEKKVELKDTDCDCKETTEKDNIFLKFRCRILYARIYTTWFVGQIMYVYNWRFGWFSIALAIIKNKLDRLQETYLELGCDQYFSV
jgi:hypothetical protein